MLTKKILFAIVLSFILGGLIICPRTYASVTSSAIVVQEIEKEKEDVEQNGKELIAEETDAKEDIDLKDVVLLFSGGISAGIVFATLMFILSLLVNLFFDIVNK